MSTPVVEVVSLKKAFAGVRVFEDVTLRVGKGEVAALIGPSGCGKSTLLRCINGLETFDEGQIRVGELRVPARVHPRRDAEQLQALRRTVGMVFQALHLFPHWDVLQNLTEAPVRVLGEARERAEARARTTLEQAGLKGFEKRMPRELSGGQQQRVAIARALQMRPDALLFDEPTSALDPRAASDVLAVMVDLAKEGQTMIVVTHGMGFARRAATQVHVLSHGKIVESGTPDRVLDQPEHETTRGLLDASA